MGEGPDWTAQSKDLKYRAIKLLQLSTTGKDLFFFYFSLLQAIYSVMHMRNSNTFPLAMSRVRMQGIRGATQKFLEMRNNKVPSRIGIAGVTTPGRAPNMRENHNTCSTLEMHPLCASVVQPFNRQRVRLSATVHCLSYTEQRFTHLSSPPALVSSDLVTTAAFLSSSRGNLSHPDSFEHFSVRIFWIHSTLE